MYTSTYDASGEKCATRTIAFPALGWALATVGTAREVVVTTADDSGARGALMKVNRLSDALP